MSRLEEQLQAETERAKKLEELLASNREKEFTFQRTTQDLSTEKNHLVERLQSLQTRT
jgi:hypothetical protein